MRTVQLNGGHPRSIINLDVYSIIRCPYVAYCTLESHVNSPALEIQIFLSRFSRLTNGDIILQSEAVPELITGGNGTLIACIQVRYAGTYPSQI